MKDNKIVSINSQNDNYGKIVKQLRIQMGLTQNDIAKSLGVTPGYICNVENGRTAMSLRILIFFAKEMNISLDSLVGQLEPSYESTSLDRDIINELSTMKAEDKKKLLATLKLWNS